MQLDSIHPVRLLLAGVAVVVAAGVQFELMNAPANFYRIIETPVQSSTQEISSAYKRFDGQRIIILTLNLHQCRLSKLYHPDKNKEGADMFMLLARAKDILTNDNTRALYDRYGPDFFQQPGHLTAFNENPNSLFISAALPVCLACAELHIFQS